MPNLGSLSTGVFTVYLLSVRNGIREICISKGIPRYDYHREHFGDQAGFGYKDLIPLLQPIALIRHLARSLSKSGSSVSFPVAEHHDGFQMYASTLAL